MVNIMQESIYGAHMLTILCMGMLAGTLCFLFSDRELRVVSIAAIGLFVLSVLALLFCLELLGINLFEYGLYPWLQKSGRCVIHHSAVFLVPILQNGS